MERAAGRPQVGIDPIAFGALEARLDDPFANRADVLTTAGLDEATHAELDDLSESEHEALLFAVVFERVGIAGSIVLIDRPDLHLAADDQARFLRALASLGEDNQIIAATSSEALVAAMEAPAVVRLP